MSLFTRVFSNVIAKNTISISWNIIFVATIGIFFFLRFFNLSNSLYFWGDIGRDHEILIEMVQKQRPVLLGPSNSVIPFNQSAWYFYLNLPVFLLSGASPFSTAITGVILNVVALVLSFKILNLARQSEFASISIRDSGSWLVFVLMYSFSPMLIEQQRSTWNPAFALPFLLLILTVVWKFLAEGIITTKSIILMALCSAFAIGMTYAVLPLVVILDCLLFWRMNASQRKNFILSLVLAGGIVFLPHLLFELKYNFVLTRQILQLSPPAATQTIWEKIRAGIFFTFGFKKISQEYLISMGTSVVLLLIGLLESSSQLRKSLLILLGIFVSSFFLSVVFISEFHSHYGIAFSLLFIFLISHLPKYSKLLICTILIFTWWPLVHAQLFQKPHRTVAMLDYCSQVVCAEIKEPIYVVAQAWHQFHSGHEYSFFLNRNDCRARDIATYPNFAQHLAVVVDASSFDEKTTDFHELSLFGPKKLLKVFSCNPDLHVYYFSQVNSEIPVE